MYVDMCVCLWVRLHRHAGKDFTDTRKKYFWRRGHIAQDDNTTNTDGLR